MPTPNDRTDPRQFARRLYEPAATAPTSGGDATSAGPQSAPAATVRLADGAEEYERWDGLS